MSNPFAQYADVLTKRSPAGVDLPLQMLTIFGAEGTGKSTLASEFPNHMYLDTEASSVELDRETLDLPTWPAFKDFITAIHSAAESPFDGKTLIIDTVSDLWEHRCLKHHMVSRKLKAMPDDFGRTLKEFRDDFFGVLNMLLDLRMKERMGCVFVAHEESEEIVTPTSRMHIHRPFATDRLVKRWLAAKPQMVLRSEVMSTNPITGESFDEPKFVLRCNRQSDSDVVKDRTKRLPKWVPNSYEKLQEAYDKGTK